MSFSLPNPTVPTNGQVGDATPILANETAIAQAIASFDGSQIQSKSVVEAALADSVNPRLRGLETLANFVYTGCLWSLVSGLNGTMTGGTVYVNGYRTIITGVGSHTFTASQDTYVYIDYLGNVTYSGVSNNSSSPSATTNAVLVAIVVTNGSTITSTNQGAITATAPTISSNLITVQDSLGNLIYPTSPSGGTIGYRQITSQITTTSTSNTQATGLSCPVIVPSGRRISIKVMAIGIGNTNSGQACAVNIWSGVVGSGTQLQEVSYQSTGAGIQIPVYLTAENIPATSSVTLNVGFRASANTAAIGAGASSPSYIKVELA